MPLPLTTRVWLAGARLRRGIHRRRRPFEPADERRRRWVAEHAPGRSFADVGGLHRLSGDIALFAEETGATDVTLVDGGDAYLTDFFQKARARNSNARFVQGDLEDPALIEKVGEHDIVWCVGVIYHSPNPVRQLLHLREITRELLYLGCHTIPEIPGVENACVYYPYVSDASRAGYAKAHDAPEAMWGVGTPFNDTPMLGYANFWWGITPSALRAMLGTARFEVVDERHGHEGPFFTELVARPIDRDPILPPLSYYREYGEHRERGEDPPPFEDYYEGRRRNA